jgi:hypothetical protein
LYLQQEVFNDMFEDSIEYLPSIKKPSS